MSPSLSLMNTLTILLLAIARATSAVTTEEEPTDRLQDSALRRVERKAWRVKRQDLVDLPSWTSPAFCTETGQVSDMASLMVHPPPSKTLDYTSLCSEVLRPSSTVSMTSTFTGDTAIIITTRITLSISTTTSEYSHSTTTALCPLPTPSSLIRCSIPALGFSKNLIYYRLGLSGVECHELCLRDRECRSFQVVPQTDRLVLDSGGSEDGNGSGNGDGLAGLRYNRCNVYRTVVDGNVSEGGGDKDGPMFWDRGCGELVSPGCGKRSQRRTQQERRDRESKYCRLERLPHVRPNVDTTGLVTDQLTFSLESEHTKSTLIDGNEIRPERVDFQGKIAEEDLQIDVNDSVRVERAENAKPKERKSPARTPSPRLPSCYNVPIIEGDDKYKLPQPEAHFKGNTQVHGPNTGTNHIARRNSAEKPADPLITPAPMLPSELDGEQDNRIEKRESWTTPDFLTSFFPLFITLACSCLISSAAPAVTSTVTEVKQVWNYTTTTSTKSEVYRFTEHPGWTTVYRTVA